MYYNYDQNNIIVMISFVITFRQLVAELIVRHNWWPQSDHFTE